MRKLATTLLLLALAAFPARAQFVDQATFAGTGGGTANAQIVTLANATSYSDILGVILKYIPSVTNTGPATINVNSFGNVTVLKSTGTGLAALTGHELVTGQRTFIFYDGTEFVVSPNISAPTRTVLTSGSGNYTAPIGCTYIRGRMAAGGAGGASDTTAGSNGGLSTFSSTQANPGNGGQPPSTYMGGVGGLGGVNGSGPAILRVPGGPGGVGQTVDSLTAVLAVQGFGGNSVFGGGTTNFNATAYGAGGSGKFSAVPSQGGDGGGGAGEYVEFQVNTPSGLYSYAVGLGGIGGTPSGSPATPGFAGAPGVIIIDEFYN